MRLKSFNILVIFMVFMFSAAFVGSGSEMDAAVRQLWLDGFLKVARAEQLVENGRSADAIDIYKAAVAVFSNIREKYPDWNASMVAFRISSCRRRIHELEVNTTMDFSNLTPEELRKRLQIEISRNAALLADLRATRQKVKTDESSAAAEREIANLNHLVSELEAKLRIEQLKVSRIKTDEQLDKLHKEITDLAIARQDDEKKIMNLTQNLEAANKQIEDLTKQLAEADKCLQEKTPEKAIVAENEQLKILVIDLRKNLAIMQEKADVKMNSHAEVEKLERMAIDLENKDDAATAARY